MTGFAIGAGVSVVALIALALALWDRSTLKARIGELETAAATARADAEKMRADVATRQTQAAEKSATEAEQDVDQTIADALANDGVIDPTATWDRHAGGAPVGVLPSAASGAGPGGNAGAVSDRGPVADPGSAVAVANPVPSRPT